jgi:hypothetical protein
LLGDKSEKKRSERTSHLEQPGDRDTLTLRWVTVEGKGTGGTPENPARLVFNARMTHTLEKAMGLCSLRLFLESGETVCHEDPN